MKTEYNINYTIRKKQMFAGIRKPIQERDELIPRIAQITSACMDAAVGPLMHIFRFDTPVKGYDSEVGYPVLVEINTGGVTTHEIRKMHTFSIIHEGSYQDIRVSTQKLYHHMNKVGLAPELELTEIYHQFDPGNLQEVVVEVQASFLAWPEVYREQLIRVLGVDQAENIWQGGDKITPFTLVDDRVEWVSASIDRLKQHTNPDDQFDILSRVALVRPAEDVQKYKTIYEKTGDVKAILEDQENQLRSGPTGGFIDPPRYDGKILHLSKVAYNRKKYDAAVTQDEIRKGYCFCPLIRESKAPNVDPIFCYRAAGWARQFWEPILGLDFKTCNITHSILKGDKYCAWDYIL
jgi:hypothetical protein